MNPNANGYRLPTEAEWDYAARGGVKEEHCFSWPSKPTALELGREACMEHFDAKKANCKPGGRPPFNSSEPRYQDYADNHYYFIEDVDAYPPNGYGLYGMLGNVWEWCWDYYGYNYYSFSPSRDPEGPKRGTNRIARGGSFNYNRPYICRISTRVGFPPSAKSLNLIIEKRFFDKHQKWGEIKTSNYGCGVGPVRNQQSIGDWINSSFSGLYFEFRLEAGSCPRLDGDHIGFRVVCRNCAG